MGLFGGEEPLDAKKIANEILKQPDRFLFLNLILKELPPPFVDWFFEWKRNQKLSKSYTEIEITLNVRVDTFLPGDIIIRRNRDPKLKDVLEIGIINEDGSYRKDVCEVTMINVKEGTISVQSHFDKSIRGAIYPVSIISVIDKVIPFGTKEWKETCKFLQLEFNKVELIDSAKHAIEWTKNNDLLKKDETLVLLEGRLKQLEKY